MMINKRLINIVKGCKKYIGANILSQWIGLVGNIIMIFIIGQIIEKVAMKEATMGNLYFLTIGMVCLIIIKGITSIISVRMSYLSSREVKKTLRQMIFKKLYKIGGAYKEKIATSEVVQIAVEGVEQLETYFGAYLPQFFYAMIAPLTLFAVLTFVNWQAATVLLVCVPLIPISIAMVQTFAKKLLSRYWGQYTVLGDTFLENLQGLTTLKIYGVDEYKNEKMNLEAEKFRKITMKVLIMQLNSITIMDLVAYGGAALGIGVSIAQFSKGNISIAQGIAIILLSADFFIPMRQLGSFFHIAMNGMASSEKIFNFLDLDDEENYGKRKFPVGKDIFCSALDFKYDEDREILKDIEMVFPTGSITAIVGESGSGKSTLGSLIMGRRKKYQGTIKVGDAELKDISETSLVENITYISHNSYIFKGTVRENLKMADSKAGDAALWQVLKEARLDKFFQEKEGLDTEIMEKATNLSGGQRQRLALARGLLHQSKIYIFDEATSNIDVESEELIMDKIYDLAKEKTVIIISHRLANVSGADYIYVLEKGRIIEEGNHEKLISLGGAYHKMWNTQRKLENYQWRDYEKEAQ